MERFEAICRLSIACFRSVINPFSTAEEASADLEGDEDVYGPISIREDIIHFLVCRFWPATL